mmetsp:Transcript_42136/g.98756  ORF Transcript_42136/g.98756 Transcript_42136/m.98756 type:complete len:119 (-) Transcript_42136:382-738(-)
MGKSPNINPDSSGIAPNNSSAIPASAPAFQSAELPILLNPRSIYDKNKPIKVSSGKKVPVNTSRAKKASLKERAKIGKRVAVTRGNLIQVTSDLEQRACMPSTWSNKALFMQQLSPEI